MRVWLNASTQPSSRVNINRKRLQFGLNLPKKVRVNILWPKPNSVRV